MTKNYKIVRVPNRLGQLLSKPGGINRHKAVDRAVSSVEELRVNSEAAIWKEIAHLEAMLMSDTRTHESLLTGKGMEDMLSQAESILNLAGTFGQDRLVAGLKSLCDVISAMMERGWRAAEPIAVHIHALALFVPSNMTALSDAQADNMLEELQKIVAHVRREVPVRTTA